MSTVVYLANQQIKVVTGTQGNKKIVVNEYYAGDAPDGSIINGMIMDMELFAGFLRDFWAQNRLPVKDVILVINSTKFVGKTIEMPALNDRKTLEFIEREFADVRRDDDFLYGHIQISSENKMKKLYVEAIYPDFIKDYIEIFSEIGVKLSGIYSGESSLIGLISMTTGKKYKTFIIQIADRMTLTTLLWVNGGFYYFNSTRCFHEQGTEDYANDIAKSVSQIIQFMQAHQIEYPLESVVLAGINASAFPLYREAIYSQGVQANIEIFDDGSIQYNNVDIQNALQPASGLVQNGKWQNYYTLFHHNSKHTKKPGEERSVAGFVAIGVSLAVMLIGLGAAYTMKLIKKNELEKIKEYNENPITMMDVARYDVLLQRNSFLLAQYNAINDIDENIYTYPVGNNVVMNKITECAGKYAEVTFESFQAEQGNIVISASSDTVDNINIFIKNLMSEDIFSRIDYTGYTYDDSDGLWDIHVSCELAESAGR